MPVISKDNHTLPLPVLFAVILIASAALGLLLLSLVYMIPVEPMTDNLADSSDVFNEEGAYPNASSWCVSELDNFTDAMMLLIAGYKGEGSPIEEALKNSRYVLEDTWPGTSLSGYYKDGKTADYVWAYTRYWHGYLLFLKPLLTLTGYSGIRIINTVLQSMLILLTVYLMLRKNMKMYILPYLISISLIAPHVIMKSLQYSTCFYLFSLGCVFCMIFLHGMDSCNSRKLFIFFLVSGICTSYFDFLTYPLVTFGMPAVFLLNNTKKIHCFTTVKILLKLLLCWLIGYGIMWLGKLVVAEVLTDLEVFSDAALETSTWLSTARKRAPYYYTVYRNLRSFALNPFMVLALAACAVYLARAVRNRGTVENPGCRLADIVIPYATVMLLPFVWYACLKAPSYIHDFFTSKTLIITAFGGISLLARISSGLSSGCYSRDKS